MKNLGPEHEELRTKIEKGLKLSFQRLLEAKLKTGGTFVFSENGVIIKVKAVDMVEYMAKREADNS